MSQTRWLRPDYHGTFQSNQCTLTNTVTSDLSHLLPQSKAFQCDILAHQSSGVWELDFEVSRVFPDGTCKE